MNINDLSLKHFNLEITKKCNQKCFYCFNDSGYSRSKDELSLEEWKVSIKSVSNLGFRSIHITGGEPFLHPNIIEILQYSIELGLDTTVLSNGLKISALCRENPNLFRKLKLAQISLDSMKPQSHNLRRGYRNAFADALSAIESLRNLKVPIEISMTVSEQNIVDVEEVGKYSKSIGASLILRPLINAGRASNVEHSFLFRKKIKEIKSHLIELCGVDVVTDKFYYVADEIESDAIIFNHGILTVEATGKIRSKNFVNLNFNDLLKLAKAA
jgi:MoaA/NifB/PqqE/SkfB family radical SAM enzyme